MDNLIANIGISGVIIVGLIGLIIGLIITISIIINKNKNKIKTNEKMYINIVAELKEEHKLNLYAKTIKIQDLKMQSNVRDFFIRAINKHAIFSEISEKISYILSIKSSNLNEKLVLVHALVGSYTDELSKKLTNISSLNKSEDSNYEEIEVFNELENNLLDEIDDLDDLDDLDYIDQLEEIENLEELDQHFIEKKPETE